MLAMFFKKAIKFLFGKEIDQSLSGIYLLSLVMAYGTALLRGVLFYRKVAFIFPGVSISVTRKCTLGRYSIIERNTRIVAESVLGVNIGRGSKIGANSIISCTSGTNKVGKGISIGEGSGFGEYCYFGCAGGVEIGDNVIAGQYVSFHSENHLVNLESDFADFSSVSRLGIKVGNNCWIGAKVTFLDGSQLGDNCIVAAGSVVRGEYPSNVIIAGVPAKIKNEII